MTARKPITLEQFYRRSLVLPFVLPIAAALVGVASYILGFSESKFAEALGFVIFTSLWSTIPYALFAALVVWRVRRRRPTSREMRWSVWLAPMIIAVPFAAAFAMPHFWHREWEDGRFAIAFMGSFALLIGYGYVLLIEFARVMAERGGWVRDVNSV